MPRNIFLERKRRIEAGQLAGVVSAGPAGTAPQRQRGGAYDLELLRLRTDKVELKGIQSLEKKIARKRELLPAYAPWVEGVLDGSKAEGKGVQDDVLVTVMLWRIDVGDFEGALPLAEYALRWKLAMPETFSRGLAVILVEEISEAALKLLANGQAAPYQQLLRVYELAGDADMPDEVAAKLQKALGMEFVRLAADPATEASSVPGATKAYRERALVHLRRAYQLHDRCGVKQDIARLAKLLGKEESDETSGSAT